MSVSFPVYSQVFPKLEQIGEIRFNLGSATEFIKKVINETYGLIGGHLEEQIDEGVFTVSSSLDANKTYRYVGTLACESLFLFFCLTKLTYIFSTNCATTRNYSVRRNT